MAKYTEWLTNDSLNKITNWARLGLTNEQIAQNMGIRESTFYDWKDKFPEFSEALKKGKDQAVETLENSMFKKANGFYEDGRYFPPDNVSLIYLLKNWAPERYSDNPKNLIEKEIEELKKFKYELENEKLKLENEKARKGLSDEDEKDQLDRLLEGVDNATIVDAKEVY